MYRKNDQTNMKSWPFKIVVVSNSRNSYIYQYLIIQKANIRDIFIITNNYKNPNMKIRIVLKLQNQTMGFNKNITSRPFKTENDV